MNTIARVEAEISRRPNGHLCGTLVVYPHEGLKHTISMEFPRNDFRADFDTIMEMVVRQLKESFLHGRGMKDRNERKGFGL